LESQIPAVTPRVDAVAQWLFLGCGSSYYAAMAAAATWTVLTGLPARAAPASELLLYPGLFILEGRPLQVVLISRSGRSSEVVKAAEYLRSRPSVRTLAISCATGHPLEEAADTTLYLLPADEESTVMTRSFTSMLLGLQALAAAVGKQSAFAKALGQLPDAAQPILDALCLRIEEFVGQNNFADYVFLGHGPLFGVASEAMLKVKEMSCSYRQCFHTLEFRHGPKAIVSSETLVSFLLSESSFEAERGVLEEVKSLGGSTLVVTNTADERTCRAADFLVELHLDIPEHARLAPYAFTGQLLGLYLGLKKGFDPDSPRHLSRVVILNERD